MREDIWEIVFITTENTSIQSLQVFTMGFETLFPPAANGRRQTLGLRNIMMMVLYGVIVFTDLAIVGACCQERESEIVLSHERSFLPS